MSTGNSQPPSPAPSATPSISTSSIKEQAVEQLMKLLGPAGAALVAGAGLAWSVAQPVVNKHVEVMDVFKANEPQQTRTLDKLAETQSQVSTILSSVREDQKEIRSDIRDAHRKLDDIRRAVDPSRAEGPTLKDVIQ